MCPNVFVYSFTNVGNIKLNPLGIGDSVDFILTYRKIFLIEYVLESHL